MVGFKICVRNVNRNGVWPVYIRVTHRRRVGYIRTEWVVDRHGLGRDGSVRDAFVLESCSRRITEYIGRLNGVDVSGWSLEDVRKRLCSSGTEGSFSGFARQFISVMERDGHMNNARLYRASLASLEGYLGTSDVSFRDIDSVAIGGWLSRLSHTRRARSLYARCMRVVFRRAMMLSREPGSGLPLIGFNPWDNVRVPESEVAEKRAIGVDECRDFFAFEVGEGSCRYQERLGQDVALLSFSLAGINTVDLYGLRKEDLRDGVIRYRRTKTRGRRKDGAYFEMRVPKMAADLIERYRAGDDSEMLLCFSGRYKDARSFNAVVNTGIRRICARMGIAGDEVYSFYSFRHTWATVARNCCGASLGEVGFAMNHINGNSVTRGYIKFDFSPAWRLNESVLEYVFGGGEDGGDVGDEDAGSLLLSPKAMVYARAYFRGEVLAEVSDIGFGTVEDVITRLAGRLPDTVPAGCAVQFRIRNVDADREAVYERTKGKGF